MIDASNLASTRLIQALNPPNERNKFTCVSCRIKFESGELQRQHFKSDWHLYNLKRKVCNLEPIELDSFIQIQSASQPKIATSQHINEPTGRKPHPISGLNDKIDQEQDDEEVWEDVDDEEIEEEELDDEEVARLLAQVIKPDTCLFCDWKSHDLESNLAHMNLAHGFFIPEEKYAIDREGLMEYLGYKIGAGGVCLWCHKQFTSCQAARLHMLDKKHCKICYDQDKAEEFAEFYDYSSQEKFKMKPITALMIPKKQIVRRCSKTRRTNDLSMQVKGSGRLAVEVIKGHKMIVDKVREKIQVKNFCVRQAKYILRTGMANNNTMRSRIRIQNPI